MSRFLLIIIAIYAIPHLAFFGRVYPILAPAMRLPVLLCLLSLMSTLFIGFDLRRHGSPFARPMVDLSFMWMAFIFWAFSAGLIMDGWNLLAKFAPAPLRPPVLPTPIQFRILTGLMIVLFAWSAFEARRVRVRHLTIPGLAAAREIRIAMISDLHLNPYGNHAAAARALALVRDLEPDILLNAGDLIDAPSRSIQPYLEELAAINPPFGKYAVLGNHEYYTGWADAIDGLHAAGFTILREKTESPIPGLVIAGIDDVQGHVAGVMCHYNEEAALPATNNGDIVIFLKHRPLVTPVARKRATLQLSGHTHGGQLFPFHFLVRTHFRRYYGLHKDDDMWLYVSRGTGTWGPRLRLFAPPELTLITIPAKP